MLRTVYSSTLIFLALFGCLIVCLLCVDVTQGGSVSFTTPKDYDPTSTLSQAQYKEGEVIVRFAPKANGIQRTIAERNTVFFDLGGGEVKHTFKLVPGLSVVELPLGVKVADVLADFNKSQAILYAQPNYLVKALSTFPNEVNSPGRFNEQWALHNTGQTGGVNDVDIDAPEAWDTITDSNVIVAVIDSGIDYNHPDLASNMWINPGEDHPPLGIVGPEDFDGINDDGNYDGAGNPLIDDLYGYDFCTMYGKEPNSDPCDDYGHGTHCAGIIGAVGNNNKGVTGVCWNVKIMALKFMASNGKGNTADAIDCIDYAVDMGAKVLNASWGDYGDNPSLLNEIEVANANGVLFVAAAGNDGLNNDSLLRAYPASYDCNNIISVMATDDDDERSRWLDKSSNFGLTTVDLAAPGSDILSCVPGNDYESWGGTSEAAPHVAGACALVWAAIPQLTHLQVKEYILLTVDKLDSLDGLCVTGGRLNLRRAVERKPPFAIFSKDVQDANCVSPFDDALQNYLTYNICWADDSFSDTNVVITDYLPAEVEYYTSEPSGTYNQNDHTVTWDIGSVGPYDSNCVTLTVKVTTDSEPSGAFTNTSQIEGDNHIDVAYETICVECWAGEILYVDDDANGSNRGISWADACNDLNDALDTVRVSDCYSAIWVAGGTYRPSPPDSQAATFNLVSGIPLYGGFAGWENSLAQRNLKDPNNEAILSGYFPGWQVSVNYIVSATNLDEATLLDGFTVTQGRTGINLSGGGLTIANCKITGNSNNDYRAPGIDAFGAALTITHSTIAYNTGNPGTGISIASRSGDQPGPVFLNITDSFIHDNGGTGIRYKNQAATGGACDIRNNTIIDNGGYGISCDIRAGNPTEPNITNCIVWGNTGGDLDGCTAQHSWFAEPLFINPSDPNEFHLGPNSPCIDAGDLNFDDFNETDFDGECRIMNGNGDLRVDIGADEYYWPKADYDQNGIVNFFDFAVLAAPWRTEDADVNLIAPDEIDTDDLAAFCDDWLWVAPWSDLYQTMMSRTAGPGLAMQSTPALSLSSTSSQQPLTQADIEDLIDWAEDLWQTDEAVKDVIPESTWNDFLDSLKQPNPTTTD